MRVRRFCCLLIALVLIAPTALASDLQTALSELSNEQIVQLYSLVVAEMYHRNVSFDEVNANITNSTHETDTNVHTSSQEDALSPIYDIISYAQHTLQSAYDALAYHPYTETIVTYDPPETPKPTPVPTYLPGVPLKDTDTVWISRKGSKFHTVPDCSGMNNPIPVLYSDALPSSSACSNCAWWLK